MINEEVIFENKYILLHSVIMSINTGLLADLNYLRKAQVYLAEAAYLTSQWGRYLFINNKSSFKFR